MDWITILDSMVPFDDQLSLVTTTYLSVVITRSVCFGAPHGSTSSDDVIPKRGHPLWFPSHRHRWRYFLTAGS